MNLDILKIASDTNNNKSIKNYTHHSKLKNSMCGDEMQIDLVIKKNKIIDNSSSRDKSISRLSKLWKFWMAVRWYFVIILFFAILLAFYQRETIGNINLIVLVVFFKLKLISKFRLLG